MVDEQQEMCTACYKKKDVSHFIGSNGKKLLQCEACRLAMRGIRRRQRADQNPDFTRARNLWQKYRITPPMYDALRAEQGYRCRICGQHEDEVALPARGRPRLDGKANVPPVRLVVDHCHDSDRVRGLLCSNCNRAIGYFGDSPARLRTAAEYLEADCGADSPEILKEER